MFHFLLACSAAAIVAVSPPLAAQLPRGGEQPLTLEATLARVRAHHPLVLAAQARADAARGSRVTARLPLNPTLAHQQENIPFSGGRSAHAIDREAMTFVTLPLEPLYQRQPRSRQASRMVDATTADLDGVRQQVALSAARAFYRVASAQIAVDAGMEVGQWLDSLLAYMSARVREGAAAEGDLIRLQVERDRADMDLALSHADAIRARADLRTFIEDTVGRVTWGDTLQATLPASLDEAYRIASARRPDLIGARARVAAARAALSFERSATIRDIAVMVGEKRMSGTRSFMAGVMLPLPIFDQNRGERQRASAELRAAEQEAAWTERQARAEVQSAFDVARMLQEQVVRLRAGFLQRAEEARRIAVGAYREGAAPLTQVLDAARAYSEARQSYYRTLFTQQQSALELRAALGADDLLRTALTVSIPESR